MNRLVLSSFILNILIHAESNYDLLSCGARRPIDTPVDPSTRPQIGIVQSVYRLYLWTRPRDEISGIFHCSSTLQRVEAPHPLPVP